ncbi:hypothetical protein PILCRDRAFT_815899 [Piloderma croceum F 1598]|uniref:Uncharacterized protein n=1 Tax=Piloderma croceum (strain F 1598) TaxID=765440 RepID=A0A0C3BJY6_PILCF|nr:hypothetical protein PILCRDRAFT_815899 [Piloderma croceum F 1598]
MSQHPEPYHPNVKNEGCRNAFDIQYQSSTFSSFGSCSEILNRMLLRWRDSICERPNSRPCIWHNGSYPNDDGQC